ncbi:MAG TPA: hypothetical protein VIK18_27180 [Pirellulales bacterium]
MRFWHLGLLLVEGAVSLTCTALESGPKQVCGTVVGTLNDTLVVREFDQRTSHTDRVSRSAVITRDGRPAKLADLKLGDSVQMLVGSPQRPLVTKIVATTAQHSTRPSPRRLQQH